jgi:serine/threonine-protein kinase MRCK
MDNNLALIKNTLSGAIIDPDRLVLGTDEGLFCLDLDRTGKISFKSSKRNADVILCE